MRDEPERTAPPDDGAEIRLCLDCRGLKCPRPIIELARHFSEVEIGELIGVEADDPAAGPDITAWCRMRRQEYVGSETAGDGVPRFVVRRLS